MGDDMNRGQVGGWQKERRSVVKWCFGHAVLFLLAALAWVVAQENISPFTGQRVLDHEEIGPVQFRYESGSYVNEVRVVKIRDGRVTCYVTTDGGISCVR